MAGAKKRAALRSLKSSWPLFSMVAAGGKYVLALMFRMTFYAHVLYTAQGFSADCIMTTLKKRPPPTFY
uniref:Putative secreted protein n=1 Tax=Rhipicephalus microplus TaxID=6941 RepID=A0A6M2DFC3_RHIMP